MRGLPYSWFSDGNTLLFKSIDEDRGEAPIKKLRPSGPNIQINSGKSAPVRTYQDLLKNAHDKALFEYYTSSKLMLLDLTTGTIQPFGKSGIINGMSTSPDGNYVMIYTIKKPFSYIVPMERFPFDIDIYSKDGKKITNLANIPLSENIPKGFGATLSLIHI